MTSPPATSVQAVAVTKLDGALAAGSRTRRGHAARSRIRLPPNRLTPPTARARTAGVTCSARRMPRAPGEARMPARTLAGVTARTFEPGFTPRAAASDGRSAALTRTRRGLDPPPASAAARADRVMDRSLDQKPVTGTRGNQDGLRSRHDRWRRRWRWRRSGWASGPGWAWGPAKPRRRARRTRRARRAGLAPARPSTPGPCLNSPPGRTPAPSPPAFLPAIACPSSPPGAAPHLLALPSRAPSRPQSLSVARPVRVRTGPSGDG